MKKLTLFLLLASVAFSCKKTTESFLPIDIKVDLKDDVSPIAGAFSIDGEFNLVEWIFEEKYSPTEYSPNPAWHVFMNKGITTVKVTAYRNETHEKFQGMKEIVIPDVAKKIKIKGLFFINLQGANPLDQKSLSITLNYNRFGVNEVKNFKFSPNSLSPSDTLFFPDPIIYNIEGFLDGGDDENILYLSISDRENPIINFNSMTYLKGDYMASHAWCPDWIQCRNMRTNDFKQIFLLTDYLPE